MWRGEGQHRDEDERCGEGRGIIGHVLTVGSGECVQGGW